ncbi:MAG TPA: agmatinase [Oscillospiraceae bacterium]|nr:agmatinase [Oscillospiraceae bacterium]HPF55259.1 agmatinase [Clostridiales bacterium]HPK36015.1 agmatinase [Oscillospiraceae bacterium]HPR76310.1 agmatinase [Oscillospiraceae bacterium]
MDKNVQTFLACDAEYAEAQAVLFGAPFDGTTSFRPGTRFGPSAIRSESFGIETYSPYCDKDLADYSIFDGGDLELPFGNTERVLAMIEAHTAQLLADEKRFVMLGGEHLVTLGALRAVTKRYPDLRIIHLDAHTDLRDEYIGEKLSHSTVMRRAWELVGDGKIHQFGIRSGEKYEFEFAQVHTNLRKFDLEGFEKTIAQLKDQPVYFSLDLDILDSSVFCGTGTPEAGGVTFQELMNAVLQLHELNIVGCDINELSPHYDQSGSSTAVACKITREVLLQLIR